MSTQPARGWLPVVLTWALLLVLGVVLVQATADKVGGQVVRIGEAAWPGYALSLRHDPEPPLCDLERAKGLVAVCVEPSAEPAAPSAPSTDGDPFGAPDGDPFGAPADDPFGEPAAGEAGPETVPCPAARQLLEQCEQAHVGHAEDLARITPAVRAWRSLDLALEGLARFAYGKHLLSIVLLLGGLQATWLRMHIALRNADTRRGHVLSQVAQLVAHLLLAASSFADWQVGAGLEIEVEHAELPLVWVAGFGALAGVNLWHLARPPVSLEAEGSLAGAVMAVPLYAWMALLAGAWFLLGEHHPSGQAIYLHKFAQFPTIYLAIALYVWGGMLLQGTHLPRRVFDLVRPWGLPPLLLGWVVVVLAAFPTAYSGASGIFVIAAGAVIFEELRHAGATPQQAMMTTAMSGSLGVVLRPCLVVVLVAALNKEVTTDQLFGMGIWVFLLTATIFLVAMLLLQGRGWKVAPSAKALPASGRAALPLLPYLVTFALVIAVFAFMLDTPLNERSAPWMLPIALLAVLAFESREHRGEGRLRWHRLVVLRATGHTAGHVGALLFLMFGTVGLGGLVERSEVMALVPESFGSQPVTMAVLVVIMVLVGMTMDAMGAVILVSVTVADIAYRNGIDPVHFWMMVLVAFELGYLTPPVALNHLLARQVAGDEADVVVQGGYFARYQHVLVPMAVMGTALLLVAFVPLFW